MISMKQILVPAVALASAVALIGLTDPPALESPVATAAHAAAAGPEPTASRLAQPLLVNQEERVGGGAPRAPLQDPGLVPGSAPTDEIAPLGHVVGFVSDENGRPGVHRVLFEPFVGGPVGNAVGNAVGAVPGPDPGPGGDPALRTRAVLSGAGGEYRCALTPGTWIAYVDWGDPSRVTADPSYVFAGFVNVQSDREELLDITCAGTRTLSAGFYREDLDEVLLEVELFLAEDPSFVVAKAHSMTNNADFDEYLNAQSKGGPGADANAGQREYPPGIGHFRLAGLTPDLYEVRAYLDVGKRFYVTASLDLREQDLALAPVGLGASDFLKHRSLELR